MAPNPASDIDQARCLSWVKTGNTRSEQMTSALPPKADSSRTSRQVRFVPRADLTSDGEIDLPACPQFMRQQAVMDKLIGRRRHGDLAPETHDGSIPVFQFAHLSVCNVAL